MIVAVQNPSPNAKLGTLSVHPQLHIFSKISDQRVPPSPNNLSTVTYSACQGAFILISLTVGSVSWWYVEVVPVS